MILSNNKNEKLNVNKNYVTSTKFQTYNLLVMNAKHFVTVIGVVLAIVYISSLLLGALIGH